MKFNEDHLNEVIDYTVNHLPMVANLNLNLVRGRPKDSSAINVNLEKYKEAVQKIENYVLNGKLRNFNHFFQEWQVLLALCCQNQLLPRTVSLVNRRVELKQAGVGQSCAQRANILYSTILREFASARVPDRTSGGPAIQ